MDNVLLGRKLARLRKQKEMSTTELAVKAGLSQPQISRLENGRQGFRSATLSRIADALDVTPAYFFDSGEAVEARTQTQKSRSELGKGFIDDLVVQFGDIVVTPGYKQTIKRFTNALSRKDCDAKILRRLVDRVASMSNDERLKLLASLNGK
ncbi:MAG: helix-turn-helix domain-containing protein [Planctomycetota bacterium]|jgi:transcriptional regulator with XRE-family HTH domain